MTSVFEHPVLGGLFDDAEACEIWSSEQQSNYFLVFEAAFSMGLGEAGIVEKSLARDAAKLIKNFRPDVSQLSAGMQKDGVAIPALVRQLRQAAPELSEAIHSAATSQDVVDTALSMSIRDMNNLLEERLKALSSALIQLDQRFGRNRIMGRTRMQAALATNAATRIATWKIAVDENIERLSKIRSSVERVQLGGAVGDNQKLDGKAELIAKIIAQETGLNVPGNSWHTTRGHLADYANLLSLITGATGKIGQDICLMSQQGIDEISLSGGGQSSAMPHKQNPVLAELLVTLARYNATQLPGMHHALIHEQERSGSAWALEWMILPQMSVATGRAVAACSTLCGQITEMGK